MQPRFFEADICRVAVVAAVLMLSSTPVAASVDPAPDAAATGAPTPVPLRVVGTKEGIATESGPPDIDKVVCKTELDTGSRIKSTKHCMSQRQSSAAGRQAAKRIDENVTPVSLTD